MTDKTQQTELYVSCRPQRPPSPFCVRPGKSCLLQACGLAVGQSVPILKSYGGDGACEPARDLAGNLVELIAERPAVLITLPGNYKLDVSSLAEDPCVYITEDCFDRDGAPLDAAPFAAPKRYVTTVGPPCDFIGPEPECAVYRKYTKFYNCEPLQEDCWTKDGQPVEPSEEDIMALTPIAAPKPSIDCEIYCTRFVAVDGTSGVTDGTTLLDFILANDPGDGEYETLGAVDPATDTVLSVVLSPRPEDGEDTVLVDGIAQGGYTYDVDNGAWSDASGATIEIPEGCNFLAVAKLKRKFDTKTGEAVTSS